MMTKETMKNNLKLQTKEHTSQKKKIYNCDRILYKHICVKWCYLCMEILVMNV